MDEIKGPKWAESVEGLMNKLGLSREDAQFMYDFERYKFGADLSLVPTVMRLYQTGEDGARWLIALMGGEIPGGGPRKHEVHPRPRQAVEPERPRGNG
jgi:hypothetical protein